MNSDRYSSEMLGCAAATAKGPSLWSVPVTATAATSATTVVASRAPKRNAAQIRNGTIAKPNG